MNLKAIIQSSIDVLYQSGLLADKIVISETTPLFGTGSGIDSMGFVSLVTDIEDRINEVSDQDVYIVLADLQDLFPDEPILTVGMFEKYLNTLI